MPVSAADDSMRLRVSQDQVEGIVVLREGFVGGHFLHHLTHQGCGSNLERGRGGGEGGGGGRGGGREGGREEEEEGGREGGRRRVRRRRRRRRRRDKGEMEKEKELKALTVIHSSLQIQVLSKLHPELWQ